MLYVCMQYNNFILLFLNVAMIYFMVLVNWLHMNNKKMHLTINGLILMACLCNLICL